MSSKLKEMSIKNKIQIEMQNNVNVILFAIQRNENLATNVVTFTEIKSKFSKEFKSTVFFIPLLSHSNDKFN